MIFTLPKKIGFSKTRGFTLVELLITIAIVGILAGAVILAINPGLQMKKSRDSRRMSDLDTFHKAVLLAMADGEIVFPDALFTGGTPLYSHQTDPDDMTGTAGWFRYSIPTGKQGLVKYYRRLPVPPLNGQYRCVYKPGGGAPQTTGCLYGATYTTLQFHMITVFAPLEAPDEVNPNKLNANSYYFKQIRF